MEHRGMAVTALLLGILAASAILAQPADDVMKGLQAAERSVARATDGERPAAFVDESPIAWSELTPLLAEAAGSVVLEEVVLDRKLRKAMRDAGLALTQEMVDRERLELSRAMGSAGLSDPDAQAAALREVLASRGLGELRLRGLLERNAMLRALASQGLTVSDAELLEAHDAVHGERVRARIIVSPSNERIVAALGRLREATAGGEDIVQAFAREAREISTDASAANGGRLEAISVRDRRYGEPLRMALATTSPGQVSSTFNAGSAWGIVLVESRIPADGSTPQQNRGELEAAVLLRKQRVRMQDLAESLGREAKVEVVDPSLRWSWNTRADSREGP